MEACYERIFELRQAKKFRALAERARQDAIVLDREADRYERRGLAPSIAMCSAPHAPDTSGADTQRVGG